MEPTPDATGEPTIVYFSSVSENTHRFVQKTGIKNLRLPLRTSEEPPQVSEPFVLCVPSYGRPGGAGSVPPQAIKFLNNPANRALLKGVIGAGNTNFGELFCVAADKIAAKCHVPVLYKFELMGTEEDVATVQEGIKEFWIQNSLYPEPA
ncbi:class Ib ribonucleoside-diphosphate reductase assembly flavoprotein NrdI [Rothia nasimurium]|uniref:class Ib ribonucleoside-diphosphate reductase assembly flavoprotein NrdI n=1 Tax=Rothia nasimurium TaxID=85336 RepID=UPI001F001D60|nr:class Ib ribonucleoside-diphosphate reductase assembly flavoprotein NrdI [Rothia nasimurium]